MPNIKLKSKYSHIDVRKEDDFLYVQLINLFNQIKTVQGASELNYSLRNHWKLRDYCIRKQIERIKSIETRYFNDDGSLNFDAVNDTYLKNFSSLHEH